MQIINYCLKSEQVKGLNPTALRVQAYEVFMTADPMGRTLAGVN